LGRLPYRHGVRAASCRVRLPCPLRDPRYRDCRPRRPGSRGRPRHRRPHQAASATTDPQPRQDRSSATLNAALLRNVLVDALAIPDAGRDERIFPSMRRIRKAVAAVVTAAAAAVAAAVAVPPALAAPAVHRASAVAFRPGSGHLVVDWNRELIAILGTTGTQPATVHPTRSFAILQAAEYDAVTSITRAAPSYRFTVPAPRGARPDAAADEAAHDVLTALYPALKAGPDQLLAGELAAIPDCRGKQQGI